MNAESKNSAASCGMRWNSVVTVTKKGKYLSLLFALHAEVYSERKPVTLFFS